jgi:hypothetical protein
MPGKLHIGLMSGTSLDGIDAVLADFDAPTPLITSHFVAMPDALRAEFLALLRPGENELARTQEAAYALSQSYAEAAHALLKGAAVDASEVRAIGCHGQTVRHQPERGYTVQLVNGAMLAELTGIWTPWPMLWHRRGVSMITGEVLDEADGTLPLNAPLLVQALLTLALVTPMGPLVYRLAFRSLADASVLLLLIVAVGVHFALTGLGLLFSAPKAFATRVSGTSVLRSARSAFRGRH